VMLGRIEKTFSLFMKDKNSRFNTSISLVEVSF
jgi:hypothetical protein